MRLAHVAVFLTFASATSVLPPAFGAEEPLGADAMSRMVDVLGDRQLALPEETAGGILTRGSPARPCGTCTGPRCGPFPSSWPRMEPEVRSSSM